MAAIRLMQSTRYKSAPPFEAKCLRPPLVGEGWEGGARFALWSAVPSTCPPTLSLPHGGGGKRIATDVVPCVGALA